jgi:hypothetical protein
MADTTTRNRINMLILSGDEAEVARIADDLGARLDDLLARLFEIQNKLDAGTELRALARLDLLEERARLEEDVHLARESLAYLRFRQKQATERALRDELRDLSQGNEPSMYRKDLIEYLLRHHDVKEMKQLLNSLMEQRSRIITNRETLENALQHFSIETFIHYEVALSTVDDVLGGLDTDITLLWNELNRDL